MLSCESSYYFRSSALRWPTKLLEITLKLSDNILLPFDSHGRNLLDENLLLRCCLHLHLVVLVNITEIKNIFQLWEKIGELTTDNEAQNASRAAKRNKKRKIRKKFHAISRRPTHIQWYAIKWEAIEW